MLDINLIRQNPEAVKKGITAKNVNSKIVDDFLVLDKNWREMIKELDDLRAEQKTLSRTYAEGNADLRGKVKELKDKIQNLEADLKKTEEKRQEILETIPNLPLDDVPIGKNEKDNVVLREIGKKPEFDFEPKDHLELSQSLDIIDFETGSKTSGSGFYYLKNQGVLLELALVRYALDFLAQKGFSLWLTPDLVRERFYKGIGFSPKGPEAQIFKIENSDLGLIATAEITLAGIHSDETLKESDLPKRYAGYSHCFRQEAGAYGRYSKGLYRVHQFTKVEMFAYTKPEDSAKMHDEFLKLEEKLWQSLGIPYRVVEMCTGDLGAQAARKFDLEAWLPGRGDWGEVTSTSNTTDYQARRLNIRYKSLKPNNQNLKPDYVHTLNGTAIATSRAIIAILENYQQKNGSVLVPETLQKYLGFEKII